MRRKKEDVCTLLHTAERILVQYLNSRSGFINVRVPRDKALTEKKIVLVNQAGKNLIALRGRICAMPCADFNEEKSINELRDILSKLRNDARDLDTLTCHSNSSYKENVTVFGQSFKALRETSLVQSDLILNIEQCEAAVDAFLMSRAEVPEMGVALQAGYH
ncbi:MAG: hypothetical protein NTZ67_05340 [Gammaproteobacteria bacterium]|nr:hypothetical protein [Gammaproteobacteria bacterium]